MLFLSAPQHGFTSAKQKMSEEANDWWIWKIGKQHILQMLFITCIMRASWLLDGRTHSPENMQTHKRSISLRHQRISIHQALICVGQMEPTLLQDSDLTIQKRISKISCSCWGRWNKYKMSREASWEEKVRCDQRAVPCSWRSRWAPRWGFHASLSLLFRAVHSCGIQRELGAVDYVSGSMEQKINKKE